MKDKKPAVKDVIMEYLATCKIRGVEPKWEDTIKLVTDKVGADETYIAHVSTHFPWYCSRFREHFKFIEKYKELEKQFKVKKGGK